MLKTGKDLSQGQAFHRRLLSEYNTDITLDNYVSYFELKPLAKKIEHIRQALESKYRDRYTHRSGSNSDSTKACAVTPLRPPPCAASEAVTPTTRGEGKSLPTPSALGAAERQSSVSTAVFVDPLSPLFFKTRGFAELQSTDTALAELIRSRIELQEAFFEKLHESYLRVKRYIMSLERDFVDAAAELRTFDELHIRNELPRDYIPALYLKLEVMLKYRALNLMAFRKILKKFLERCACDSLELQQRVTRIDELIHVSRVSQPSMDLRSAALDLIAVYGTAFRLTYEQAVGHMREYENRTGVNAQRILPNSETFFVADAFPHNERPGNFAARVLAGSCSVFCEKMITEVLQCPRYPGNSCSRFANGEVSVNLQGPVRGDDVFVVQSMVALESENLSNAGALMELVLLIHSVQLAAAARITAVVPYLAYTRNAASISAVAEMIESAGCHHVVTVDMHSEQVEGMFSIPMESISATYEFVRYISDQLRSEGNAFNNITVVAPTGEFLGRAKEFADVLMRYNHLDSSSQFVSVCTAVRRVETRQSACTSRGARQDCDAQRTTAVVGGGGGSHGSHPSAHTDAAAASLLPCHHTSHQQHHHPPPHGAHKSQPLPAPTSRSAECGTPNSSGVASVATSQLLVNSPVGGGYAALYPHSPTTPNAGDAVASELVAVVGGESPAISLSMTSNYPGSGTITTATLPGSTHGALLQQQQQQQQSYHHFGSSMPRSSSTLGMERALRLHEEGRQAVITRKEEATRNEYKKYVLVGDVKDRLCIMIETVIDEAVTIAQVARCLHEHGAARIILVATHAVMSGKAAELLINSPIELVVVTDSVNQDELMKSPALARKLRVVPIAPLLARAIEKIHTENTLATLFDKS
ncbi:ribose-phosphate pyrophosphokinase [Novymonas esmeraldas]|uniref:Ribose-phosphate pyrophosphokinase n=1 Tax=Novymonas esmeraldas TaxID=1808958 RepID=A0AAW0F7W8_9TRYP